MLKKLLIVALVGTPVLATAKTMHADKSSKTAQKSDVEKLKVKDVRFVGNSAISDSDLSENLVNKSQTFGLLGGDFHPDALERDAMIIRDTYFQHGYIDVRISKPSVTKDHDGKVIITYNIKEGAPYNVSYVHIATAKNIDRDKLTSGVALKSGKTFNVETLRKDLKNISTEIGSQGYAFAKVQPRFRKNSHKRTIGVVYTVVPGRKATINDIIIKGNAKTQESVIRSYLTLAPGDQYSLSDVIDMQDELSRTGFFENVSIRPIPAGKHRVNLEVTVQEAKTGSIMGAAGYDSMEGLFIEGSFGDKNLLGSGINLSLSASMSKLKKNGTLSFDDPRVAGTLIGLYGGIYRTDTKDDSGNTYGFDKKELGGYLGLRRKITDELSASIDYGYNNVSYSNINVTMHPTGLKNYIKSAIGVGLVYNNTDNYYTPRRGIIAQARLEYAGLGSGTNLSKYVKSSMKFAAFYGLRDKVNYDLIMRYKLQANYIHDLGFVPEAERLHLGGYYNGVRGYRSASIHPGVNGGMMSMVTSVEASIPLSEKHHVRLTGFMDYGMIGNTSLSEVQKKSVGAQLEWRSPFGDVNFILAKAIDVKPGDKTASFEFTIGKQF